MWPRDKLEESCSFQGGQQRARRNWEQRSCFQDLTPGTYIVLPWMGPQILVSTISRPTQHILTYWWIKPSTRTDHSWDPTAGDEPQERGFFMSELQQVFPQFSVSWWLHFFLRNNQSVCCDGYIPHQPLKRNLTSPHLHWPFAWGRISCRDGWPWSYCVAKDVFELLILLPPSPKQWDYRLDPPHQVLYATIEDWTRASGTLGKNSTS